MDAEKFSAGCAAISQLFDNFSYDELLRRISDSDSMRLLYDASTNGYEKLQIFRLLDLEPQSPVIRKFINETYHIENEFVCQLDPAKFDTIPEYVVCECNRILQETQTFREAPPQTG